MWYVVIDTFMCSTGDVIEKGTILEKIVELMDYTCFQVKPFGNIIYLSQYEIDNHLEERVRKGLKAGSFYGEDSFVIDMKKCSSKIMKSV